MPEGVPGVWVGRLAGRLALKIPGFSAAGHVESPTNPGRRRSVHVPTQPHPSMISRLLSARRPCRCRGERVGVPSQFLTQEAARDAVDLCWVRGPTCAPKSGLRPVPSQNRPTMQDGMLSIVSGSRARFRPHTREPTWLWQMVLARSSRKWTQTQHGMLSKFQICLF